MAGNAFEWTADWYEQKYYERAPAKNPPGPESGRYRVIRGGSWADVAEYLSCSYRGWVRPSERSPNIGFRCAKSAGGQR
jgi:formylglycine-generating enzyme required for sulfatase activity